MTAMFVRRKVVDLSKRGVRFGDGLAGQSKRCFSAQGGCVALAGGFKNITGGAWA
jgi:hypothetical protein